MPHSQQLYWEDSMPGAGLGVGGEDTENAAPFEQTSGQPWRLQDPRSWQDGWAGRLGALRSQVA